VRYLVLLVSMFVSAPFALASAQSAAPIQQTVQDFFAAEAQGRWLDAAHMLDLTDFEAIRRAAVDAARSLGSRPNLTVKQLLEMDPSMPVAVAEYQVKSMSDPSRGVTYLSSEFARVPSADSLRVLPIDVAAARWLEARGPQWQTERAMSEARSRPQTGCAFLPDSAPRLAAGEFDVPRSNVLAATAPNDSTGYAVIGFGATGSRNRPPGEARYPRPSPRVLALRKLDGAWKVIPAEDMPHSDAMSGGGVSIVKCSREKASPPPPKS